jgi:hypothetical protein
MLWARPEAFEGQHGMPRTLLARPGPSHTSPRTNSVRPPMRSRPHVLPRPKARARPQGDSSANGSVTSSRRRFASSYLTTSVCGTTSAGQRLTAERVRGSAPANVRICRIPGGRWAAGFRRARCYPAYGSSPQRQSGPGIRCWLPDNRDSGRGQPGVLSGDIADLDPDHYRPPRTRSCRRQGGASWARRETWPCPGGQLAATDSASQDGR